MTEQLASSSVNVTNQTIKPVERTEIPATISIIWSIVFQGVLMLSALVPSLRLSTDAIGALVFVTLVTAILTKSSMAMHTALWVSAWAGWWIWIGVADWPFYLAGPLVIYFVGAIYSRALRSSIGWFKRGQISNFDIVLGIATVIISSFALWLWTYLLKPDLSDLRRAIPHLHFLLVPVMGLVFSVVNAVLEEAIWRGVIMQSTQAAVGDNFLAVAIQGVSFGIAHVNGFPRGWLGVLMASVYGTMLGLLRKQTRGMLLPLIVHVFADLTIFVLLYRASR